MKKKEDTIYDWFITIKYKIKDPFYRFKSHRTILCPVCHKERFQLRKYKYGQETRCKKCRKDREV